MGFPFDSGRGAQPDGFQMDPRKLKRLLDTFRDCGVAEFELSDKLQPTRVRYFGSLPPPPEGEVEVEASTDTSWQTGAPMALQQAYDRIRAQYERKPAKGKAS